MWRPVPPSRPLGLLSFSRIGLRSDEVRRFYQLVFLTHFVRLRSLRSSSVGDGAYRFVPHSLRSSRFARLVGAFRGYSFDLPGGLFCPLIRSAVCYLVSFCGPFLRLVRGVSFSSVLISFVRLCFVAMRTVSVRFLPISLWCALSPLLPVVGSD